MSDRRLKLLSAAAAAQEVYWDALAELLAGVTVQDLTDIEEDGGDAGMEGMDN